MKFLILWSLLYVIISANDQDSIGRPSLMQDNSEVKFLVNETDNSSETTTTNLQLLVKEENPDLPTDVEHKSTGQPGFGETHGQFANVNGPLMEHTHSSLHNLAATVKDTSTEDWRTTHEISSHDTVDEPQVKNISFEKMTPKETNEVLPSLNYSEEIEVTTVRETENSTKAATTESLNDQKNLSVAENEVKVSFLREKFHPKKVILEEKLLKPSTPLLTEELLIDSLNETSSLKPTIKMQRGKHGRKPSHRRRVFADGVYREKHRKAKNSTSALEAQKKYKRELYAWRKSVQKGQKLLKNLGQLLEPKTNETISASNVEPPKKLLRAYRKVLGVKIGKENRVHAPIKDGKGKDPNKEGKGKDPNKEGKGKDPNKDGKEKDPIKDGKEKDPIKDGKEKDDKPKAGSNARNDGDLPYEDHSQIEGNMPPKKLLRVYRKVLGVKIGNENRVHAPIKDGKEKGPIKDGKKKDDKPKDGKKKDDKPKAGSNARNDGDLPYEDHSQIEGNMPPKKLLRVYRKVLGVKIGNENRVHAPIKDGKEKDPIKDCKEKDPIKDGKKKDPKKDPIKDGKKKDDKPKDGKKKDDKPKAGSNARNDGDLPYEDHSQIEGNMPPKQLLRVYRKVLGVKIGQENRVHAPIKDGKKKDPKKDPIKDGKGKDDKPKAGSNARNDGDLPYEDHSQIEGNMLPVAILP